MMKSNIKHKTEVKSVARAAEEFSKSSNIQHTTEVESVSKAAGEFGKSLYGVIKETEKDNILFSP